MQIQEIINGCRRSEPKAQRALYDLYAPKLKGICFRYSKGSFDAEDIFQEAFVKIFTKFSSYSGQGSLEGWLKRICINTAIDHFKKSQSEGVFHVSFDDLFPNIHGRSAGIIENISASDLMNMINKLPQGYKMVFNLYVVEGYSHKEIAKMLEISEGTSKSQLSKARNLLQKYLKQNLEIENEQRVARH